MKSNVLEIKQSFTSNRKRRCHEFNYKGSIIRISNDMRPFRESLNVKSFGFSINSPSGPYNTNLDVIYMQNPDSQ